jgi:hypothetical protein
MTKCRAAPSSVLTSSVTACMQIYRHKTYPRSHVIVARTQWVDFVGYTHGADRSRMDPSCMCVCSKAPHPEIVCMFMQKPAPCPHSA